MILVKCNRILIDTVGLEDDRAEDEVRLGQQGSLHGGKVSDF